MATPPITVGYTGSVNNNDRTNHIQAAPTAFPYLLVMEDILLRKQDFVVPLYNSLLTKHSNKVKISLKNYEPLKVNARVFYLNKTG